MFEPIRSTDTNGARGVKIGTASREKAWESTDNVARSSFVDWGAISSGGADLKSISMLYIEQDTNVRLWYPRAKYPIERISAALR